MKAPEHIPTELINEFTWNGIIDLKYYYRNDCSDEIQKEINDNFTQNTFDKYLVMAKNRQQNYYGMTDTWLYNALERYPIKDKSVCIFGSANPWYEAIAIEFGCTKCTVIEYSPRPCFHEKISYVQPTDTIHEKYDVIFSISSFEHDGLGRYGDPVDPTADFKAMAYAKSILKSDGIMFLAIPIGKDTISWNVHRVYGEYRLPHLLDGWNAIDAFGYDSNYLNYTSDTIHFYTPIQPVFVLTKD